jgi:hypothetical protein
MKVRSKGLTRFAARGAAVAGALVAVQLAGAAPAGAVPGIQKVTGPVSANDSKPSKTDHADCPVGTRVLGGGGWAFPTTADIDKVGLTELRPVHPASGRDSYVVTAQEITPNITTNWSVQAYAICASPVSGLNIVSSVSNAFDEGGVVCPAGQKVLGSGGRVDNPANHVKLQMETPLSSGVEVAVAATDSSLGVPTGEWTVTSFAVCAPAPPGYQLVFAPSMTTQSESEKPALVTCPAGTRVHGAAASTAAPPFIGGPVGVALQKAYPNNALDQVVRGGDHPEQRQLGRPCDSHLRELTARVGRRPASAPVAPAGRGLSGTHASRSLAESPRRGLP